MSKKTKQLLIVCLSLMLLGGGAQAEEAAKKAKPAKPEKLLIVSECAPWDGSTLIMAINFIDGRKFTARLWGASVAEVREGQTVAFTDTGPSVYRDVSGETGEAKLCDTVGACNPVRVEIKVKLEDKTQGSVTINDETIPTVTVYDKTKATICG